MCVWVWVSCRCFALFAVLIPSVVKQHINPFKVLREHKEKSWPFDVNDNSPKLRQKRLLCWCQSTDKGRAKPSEMLSAGPEDTPYSGGCFEFDIYFPPTYPHVPMNVQIRTTGNTVFPSFC